MHLILSATVAIATLSASVIGVPTPLDTRTNATQSDDCLPSKYACDKYSGGPHHELIEVCDAQSNWQLSANCDCAEGCHLGGTIYEDSHGVLQGDTAFCQCAKAYDSADSGSLTGGILADNSFGVAVRRGVASNPTTDFTDFGQSPRYQCSAGLYTCVEGQFMYVCNSEHNWVGSSDCGGSQCCHLSGNTFVDNDGITEAATAFCRCPSKPARGVTATSLDKRDTAAGCILGTYSCDIENSQILVCDNDQYWELVAVCGGSGTCQYSPDGTPHCVGSKAAGDVTI